jgi:Na+/H+ antiporter NhaC
MLDRMTDIHAIRHVRRQMTHLLLAFSVASVVIGAIILAAIHEPWVRAIGWQFAIWGAIALVFAWMGVRQSRRAARGEVDDLAEAKQLAKTLRISDKTNWVWVLIGLVLVVLGLIGTMNPVLIAHGVGVLIQGGFLLIYDRVFMYRLQALCVGE